MTASKPPAEGTPRTDAAVKTCDYGSTGVLEYVDVEFSEQLERELQAERQRCEGLGADVADEAEVRERLAKLLADTAIALKGPELPLQGHDWSDLPKVAHELKLAYDLAEHMLQQAESRAASAEKDARRWCKFAEMWRDETFGIFTEAQEVSIYKDGKLIAREHSIAAAIDAASGEAG